MSLADLIALHDLAVEAGAITPFIFTDLAAVPAPIADKAAESAAFYAFARSTGATEAQAKSAYYWYAISTS